MAKTLTIKYTVTWD